MPIFHKGNCGSVIDELRKALGIPVGEDSDDEVDIEIVDKCEDYLFMYNNKNGTTIFMSLDRVKPSGFVEAVFVLPWVKGDLVTIKDDGLDIDGRFIHRRYFDQIEDESSVDKILRSNKLLMR